MSAEKSEPYILQREQNTKDDRERETIDPYNFNRSLGYLIDGDGTVHLLQNIEGAEIDMSNYVSKGEFEQYEKRIDQRFDVVDKSISDLPELIKKDTEILLNNYDEKRRKGNWTMIGLIVTFVSIAVTLLSILLPMIPLFN